MKKYYDSFRKTTDNIKNILEKVDQKDAVNITEIRIRSNKAIAVTIRGETKYVCADGSLTDDPKKGVRIAENEVRENVYLLCDKSEYIYYESIQNGYITDIYGNRTGISADISYRENDKAVITRYNGLNIRIGREFKGCADQIFKYIDCLSFIIVSPPGGGKTTLLKDILNHLNKKNIRVCVVDEKDELYNWRRLDCVDGIIGYPKEKGMMIAIKTLYPQVIVCDEIGSDKDIEAIEKSQSCGVDVICSVHGNEDLKSIYLKKLLQLKCFKYVIVLNDGSDPGKIKKIQKVVYANENSRPDNNIYSFECVWDNDEFEIKEKE